MLAPSLRPLAVPAAPPRCSRPMSSRLDVVAAGGQAKELQARRLALLQELAAVDRQIAESVSAQRRIGSSVPPVRSLDLPPDDEMNFWRQVDAIEKERRVEPSFGFLSKSAGTYAETKGPQGVSGPPSGFFDLARRNFNRELPNFLQAARGLGRGRVAAARELLAQLTPSKDGLWEIRIAQAKERRRAAEAEGAEDAGAEESDETARRLRRELRQLTLSNDAVWARERAREAADGGVAAPWVLRLPYYALWSADPLEPPTTD